MRDRRWENFVRGGALRANLQLQAQVRASFDLSGLCLKEISVQCDG